MTTWFSNTNLLTLPNTKRNMNRIDRDWIQAILISCQKPGRYLDFVLRLCYQREQRVSHQGLDKIMFLNLTKSKIMLVGRHQRLSKVDIFRIQVNNTSLDRVETFLKVPWGPYGANPILKRSIGYIGKHFFTLIWYVEASKFYLDH